MGSVTELCDVIGWNSRVCRLEEWRGGEGSDMYNTLRTSRPQV